MPNLTVTQAAEALQCSESTIRKMIKDGKLKTTRLRDKSPHRISQEEIDRVNSGETKRIQLRYDLRTAEDNGTKGHAQIIMKQLGYNVLQAIPQSMGDCWWFTVDKLIEPLPPYLTIMEYDFDCWEIDRVRRGE